MCELQGWLAGSHGWQERCTRSGGHSREYDKAESQSRGGMVQRGRGAAAAPRRPCQWFSASPKPSVVCGASIAARVLTGLASLCTLQVARLHSTCELSTVVFCTVKMHAVHASARVPVVDRDVRTPLEAQQIAVLRCGAGRHAAGSRRLPSNRLGSFKQTSRAIQAAGVLEELMGCSGATTASGSAMQFSWGPGSGL